MRIVFAVVVLALMASLCNMCKLTGTNTNKETNTNMATPAPAATPAKTALKDVFPQKVGDYTLSNTYPKSELKGDDKLLPGAEDVVGAVYKNSANKKEQVMVGKYASPADAETARKKRVPSSQYKARWTKGDLLFVASDNAFQDQI